MKTEGVNDGKARQESNQDEVDGMKQELGGHFSVLGLICYGLMAF